MVWEGGAEACLGDCGGDGEGGKGCGGVVTGDMYAGGRGLCRGVVTGDMYAGGGRARQDINSILVCRKSVNQFSKMRLQMISILPLPEHDNLQDHSKLPYLPTLGIDFP